MGTGAPAGAPSEGETMIETTNEMAKAIEAIREDVLYGLKGDANRVVREAKSLIGYLQELIARLPGDMREFDINDAAQYNAIIRIVEAVEGSDRDMTRTWKDAHAAGRAQLQMADLIADRLPKAEAFNGEMDSPAIRRAFKGAK